ncbi:MAG: S8 family peptidase [Nitriliruptorales bacterium]|nr:S8 family peptidase [Nitriliruptorales bacterium]
MRTQRLSTPRLVPTIAAAVAALMALAILPPPRQVPSLTAATTPAVELAIEPVVEEALARSGEVAVIVQIDGDRTADLLVRAAIVDHGGAVTTDLPIIDGFAAVLTAAGLDELRSRHAGSIRAITLDGQVRLSHTAPSGEVYDDSFFVETMGADQLYRKGYDGTGVGIALIDTGVTEIADLSGRVSGGVDLTVEADGVDRYGHGTFVAGIAAGDGARSKGEHAGVAPGAHVVPVKIAGANGAADVSQALAALQWVVSFKDTYNIGVLNLSFGTDSDQSQLIDPLNYAVERAWDAGIVVVVAAANLGPDSQTVMKPGDDPLVITVGATDSNGTVDRDDDVVAEFSSRGPTRADGHAKPDLVAPGAHLVGPRVAGSTIDASFPHGRVDKHYFRGSGTSFSTAAVSGAVALLRQSRPKWSPDQIKGALLATAAAGPVGDRNIDGYGAIDVAAAFKLRKPPTANVGVERSDGTGSLEASRGSLILAIEKDVLSLFGLVDTVLEVLTGEKTVQDALYDATEFATTEWTGKQWYSSQWVGKQWYGTDWNGKQWYGKQWYADEWR